MAVTIKLDDRIKELIEEYGENCIEGHVDFKKCERKYEYIHALMDARELVWKQIEVDQRK